MLRVGLTGELGSGKSTVARLLGELGAVVLSSDEIGRALMQPGQAVYRAIVDRFGPGVVLPDGQLDRPGLARLAFDPEHPRVEELNAMVHPAVIAAQERELAALGQSSPCAIVVVESALLLTTRHAGGDEPWRRRFDCIVVVSAPEELQIQRFLERATLGQPPAPEQRAALRRDAETRLAAAPFRRPGALDAAAGACGRRFRSTGRAVRRNPVSSKKRCPAVPGMEPNGGAGRSRATLLWVGQPRFGILRLAYAKGDQHGNSGIGAANDLASL